MLNLISFRFGAAPKLPPLAFSPGHMTVFVGPNNAGKSLVLVELEQLASGEDPQGRHIVESLSIRKFAEAEAQTLLRARRNEKMTLQSPPGQIYLTSVHPINESPRNTQFQEAEAIRRLTEGIEPRWVMSQILTLYTLRLDGATRLSIVNPRTATDLQSHPGNILSALFRDDASRLAIRQIIFDAFGHYFVVDPTGMSQFRIRMAGRAPADSLEEQALDERARKFHSEATLIQQMSDGVKAFTGLVAAVMSSDYRLMLVDEPEAFLHPPLARMLGRTLSELASRREAHVFASTHSADFLMGAVESGRSVNVVRLTYERASPTARLLSASDLTSLLRDPLLRSTGILAALFHKGAVVCEADSDRAFYQEINNRLITARLPGVSDALFANAHTKSVLGRIAKPLRQLGIPAAVIVDLDIIKVKDEFRELLNNCFIPPALVHAWQSLRGNVVARFEAGALDMKKGGISLLAGSSREELDTLLRGLAEYGVFLVPQGELESWLPALRAVGHGNDWLESAFREMGSDPDEPDYLKPGEDDVWSFVGAIGDWVRDPLRKGIPT